MSAPIAEQAEQAPSPALAPPPGNPRFPLFDGLRGLAVLAIFAYHSFTFGHRLGVGVTGRIAEAAGGQAVITFFAISGFLLYRPFVAARFNETIPPQSAEYGRRRALRILPGYWAILTLLAIFPGIVGVFTHNWWRYYGYLQLYSGRTLGGGIPVAWTLCIEVTFYIVMPIWAWGMRRAGAKRVLPAELLPLVAVGLAGALIQFLAAQRHISYLVGVSLAGQCTWIIIGMALAVASAASAIHARVGRVLHAIGERPEWCWLTSMVAFAVLVALVPKGGLGGLVTSLETRQPAWKTLLKLLAQGVCVTALLWPAVFGGIRKGLPRRLLAWRPVVWLGVISYSFYLLHITIIEFISLGHSPYNFSSTGLNLESHYSLLRLLTLIVTAFIGTVLLASLSYRFIELPFLRRKERARRRR